MNQQVGRFGSLAAFIGGAMWITYYGIDLISGALGQRVIEFSIKDAPNVPLVALVFLLFNGATLGFNGANLALFRRLGGRSRGWGIAGFVFSALAAIMVVLATVASVTGFTRAGVFSGMGVLTTCIATTLLGVATLRARALPGKARVLPLAIGALTFPFIITITIILGAFLPDYAISEFPFAASGLGWIAIGLVMRAGARHQEAPRGALVAA